MSHEIGSIGLLERENAAVMNAALTGVAQRATNGFVQALAAAGVNAATYLSQNDGTLMSLSQAAEYPVLTVASGPTNSLRGGALLSGRTDAIVIDVGGTTADLGRPRRRFPARVRHRRRRRRGRDELPHARPRVGGPRRRHDRPRRGGAVRLGPDSVGYEITRRALCFGGDTLTLTDIAVAAV